MRALYDNRASVERNNLAMGLTDLRESLLRQAFKVGASPLYDGLVLPSPHLDHPAIRMQLISRNALKEDLS